MGVWMDRVVCGRAAPEDYRTSRARARRRSSVVVVDTCGRLPPSSGVVRRVDRRRSSVVVVVRRRRSALVVGRSRSSSVVLGRRPSSPPPSSPSSSSCVSPMLLASDGPVVLSVGRRAPRQDVPKELLSSHLPSAFDFLDEAKEAGETVLVHCRSGASRPLPSLHRAGETRDMRLCPRHIEVLEKRRSLGAPGVLHSRRVSCVFLDLLCCAVLRGLHQKVSSPFSSFFPVLACPFLRSTAFRFYPWPCAVLFCFDLVA